MVFIGVIMITGAFTHNNNTLKWIDYNTKFHKSQLLKISYQENSSQVYSSSIGKYQKYLWSIHLLTQGQHFWDVFVSKLSWFWGDFFLP